MPRQFFHLLFLCLVLLLSLLPLRVQAALPKELPTAPAKFLTGACLTRSEDLWITAEAGDIGNVPNRRLRRFGNSRRSFAADVCFRGENVRSNHGEIIHPLDRSSSPPSCHGRQGAEPTGLARHHASTRNSCNWSSRRLIPAGSGQEVGGKDDFFPCISGIFRLFFCLGRGIIKL